MRYLVILLLFVSFVAKGQTVADQSTDGKINTLKGQYSHYHVGDSDELTATGDSTWTYDIWVATGDKLTFDVDMDVDSVGGTSSAANEHYFFLSYKEMPNESYTAIGDTATYAGTVDTTFTLSSGATAVKARYIRINCIGENDTFISQLGDLLLKVWK